MQAVTQIEILTEQLYREKLRGGKRGQGSFSEIIAIEEFQVDSNTSYKEYIHQNYEYLRMQNEMN